MHSYLQAVTVLEADLRARAGPLRLGSGRSKHQTSSASSANSTENSRCKALPPETRPTSPRPEPSPTRPFNRTRHRVLILVKGDGRFMTNRKSNRRSYPRKGVRPPTTQPDTPRPRTQQHRQESRPLRRLQSPKLIPPATLPGTDTQSDPPTPPTTHPHNPLVSSSAGAPFRLQEASWPPVATNQGPATKGPSNNGEAISLNPPI